MTDDRRIDLRDRLPDLIHGTVDPADRAALDAALSGDADLRAELAAVEAARRVCTPRVPSPDVARIVAALPAAPRRRGAPVVPIGSAPSARWSRVRAWRVAAAVVVLVGGGTAVTVARRGGERPPSPAVAVTPAPAPAPERGAATPPAASGHRGDPGQVAFAPGIAGQTDLSDLSEAELASLIAALDELTGDVHDTPDDQPLVGAAAGVTLPGGDSR